MHKAGLPAYGYSAPISTSRAQSHTVNSKNNAHKPCQRSASTTTETQDESPTPPFDAAAEARLLRALDLRVLPILWLLFLICFIDRSNIGNAKIAGMEKELDLKGQWYNVAVFTFNIGYLVAGVPLSVVVEKYGSRSLSVMMFCWDHLWHLAEGEVWLYSTLLVGNRRKDAHRGAVGENGEVGRVEGVGEKGAWFRYSL
ncbi:hypothetical protein P171DRAFT_509247 [Karstenula rhodostoma CBS 690.94]|uniref:MFS general substrate transporter n=1 Tax=Karstenula rhodostoma CBS 690.94 TaxID=1392251 RepID=A0A9P4PU86_9PLEO|nr:hypothetical protein P171DRAFT_509247 [Karstenula rhodostoma CBS 690.94]